MDQVKLTFPKKLSRVEIISSRELNEEDYFQYLPLIQVPVDNFVPDIFDEEIAQLRNIDSEKEMFDTLDIPIQQTFYREVSFTDQKRPIRIALNKLPQSTILISEAKKKIQEAYDKGFKEGQEITEDYFVDEIRRHQNWVKNFDQLSYKLRQGYSQELRTLEESIVSLAMLTAEHVLQNEIKSNPDVFIGQIKKVLQEIDNETIFKIYINPKNVAVLENVQSSLLSGYNAEKVVIEPSESVDILGCILETSSGKINATMKSQIEHIKSKLETQPLECDLDIEIENRSYNSEENHENQE